jgi:hypothetical protein
MLAQVTRQQNVDPDLTWLANQIWGTSRAVSGVQVHFHRGPSPDRNHVESYAVVPSNSRAAFLVPLGSRQAAWASLSRYNALRQQPARAQRAILAAMMRWGIGPSIFRDRLSVFVDEKMGELHGDNLLLSTHLSHALNVSPLAMAFGVHPTDPNHKPTAQLFDLHGKPVGFAKIGWNDATRDLVTAEADALGELGVNSPRGMQLPRLLHRGDWNGLRLSVSAPLPLDVRAHKNPDLPPVALTRALAEVRGLQEHPLAQCEFWLRLRALVDVVCADDQHTSLGAKLRHYVETLDAAYSTTTITCGTWHGDWVPWNMGWRDGTLQVWDWEHSSHHAPVGFDLLHWTFQVSFVLRGRPLRDAVAATDGHGVALLAELEVPRENRGLLTSLYLLEMFLRTYRLMSRGAGWNGRLYPAMLELLDMRPPDRG